MGIIYLLISPLFYDVLMGPASESLAIVFIAINLSGVVKALDDLLLHGDPLFSLCISC